MAKYDLKEQQFKYNAHLCGIEDEEIQAKRISKKRLSQKNREAQGGSKSHQSKRPYETNAPLSQTRKIKANTRNSILQERAVDKCSFTPLTQLDRIKLANHLEELALTVIEFFPSHLDTNDRDEDTQDSNEVSKATIQRVVS